MTTTRKITMRRDPAERPSGNWSVGYYRWIVTAACYACGEPFTTKVSGTRGEVEAHAASDRWQHIGRGGERCPKHFR